MTLNAALIVVAIVLFVLVALGVTIGNTDALRLVSSGLALFAAAHLPIGGGRV